MYLPVAKEEMPLSKIIIKAKEKVQIEQFRLESFDEEGVHEEISGVVSGENKEIVDYVFQDFNRKSEEGCNTEEKEDNLSVAESAQNSEPSKTDDSVEENKPSSESNSDKELQPLNVLDFEKLAEEKIAKALEEAENIKKQAYEEGKKAGYQEGFRDGLEEGKEYVEKIKGLVTELESVSHKVLKDYKSWIVDAAFKIASHIVRTELTTNKQIFLNMLEELVKQLEEESLITIYLNPEDMVTLRLSTDLEEWAQIQGRAIRFKEDPNLSLGSCRLETDVELLDATLESCIEELKREALASIV